jgi:predicted RNA-binding Zn-ribbon protein involved in translation (DUF1610 family)
MENKPAQFSVLGGASLAEQNRSGAQKLFAKLVSPAGAARMEAESRTWIVRCPKCGYERSAWDTGSVIYKGAGTRYWFMRCPNCGKMSWNKVYWPKGVTKGEVYAKAVSAAGTGSATTSELSNRAPWLVWLLAAVVWIGLIVAFVAALFFVLNSIIGR